MPGRVRWPAAVRCAQSGWWMDRCEVESRRVSSSRRPADWAHPGPETADWVTPADHPQWASASAGTALDSILCICHLSSHLPSPISIFPDVHPSSGTSDQSSIRLTTSITDQLQQVIVPTRRSGMAAFGYRFRNRRGVGGLARIGIGRVSPVHAIGCDCIVGRRSMRFFSGAERLELG